MTSALSSLTLDPITLPTVPSWAFEASKKAKHVQSSRVGFDKIPEDVVLQVFTYLNEKDKRIAAMVSKNWNKKFTVEFPLPDELLGIVHDYAGLENSTMLALAYPNKKNNQQILKNQKAVEKIFFFHQGLGAWDRGRRDWSSFSDLFITGKDLYQTTLLLLIGEGDVRRQHGLIRGFEGPKKYYSPTESHEKQHLPYDDSEGFAPIIVGRETPMNALRHLAYDLACVEYDRMIEQNKSSQDKFDFIFSTRFNQKYSIVTEFFNLTNQLFGDPETSHQMSKWQKCNNGACIYEDRSITPMTPAQRAKVVFTYLENRLSDVSK